jgi:cysteine desulfuration protein SufE
MLGIEARMTIDEILESFELLDEWEERYRYLIEIGRTLPPFPEAARTAENKVQGCVSQVWLQPQRSTAADGEPVLSFLGDSDAHLVRGLVAVLLALYSGRKARDILATDAETLLERLGLREHLTPQRSNGLRGMVTRIRNEAEQALAVA